MTGEIHPSLLVRKIIHVDMDCYFAAVETLDFPELRGKPVVIGGQPGSRGVVAAANYEARKFGVHSAMPTTTAAKLCPDLIFRPSRFERYKELTGIIRAIFRRFTDSVEPMSLDEAYLDVTRNELGLYAVKIAQKVREDIYSETGLTASAGVAPNKMVAKIASDMDKPNGLTVVLPANVKQFMEGLDVGKIPGIGPSSSKRLAKVGIRKCGDVTHWDPLELRAQLGNLGSWLFKRAQGIDERAVMQSWTRKSMGRESTYRHDLERWAEKIAELSNIATSVAGSLRKAKVKGRTVQIKVRYNDFHTITRAKSLTEFTDQEQLITEVAIKLLEKTESSSRPIRLLGVSMSGLNNQSSTAGAYYQPELNFTPL